MMNVKDYAKEMNTTVEKVLELCKEYELNIKNPTDTLDDDAIIILDNYFNNENVEDKENPIIFEEDKYDLEERVLEYVESNGLNTHGPMKKQK